MSPYKIEIIMIAFKTIDSNLLLQKETDLKNRFLPWKKLETTTSDKND